MKKDIYKKIAKNVIDTEIISLNKLKSSLDINFKKAVHPRDSEILSKWY